MILTKLAAAALAAVLALTPTVAVADDAGPGYAELKAPRKPAKPRKAKLTVQQKVNREVGRVYRAGTVSWVVVDLPGRQLGRYDFGVPRVLVDHRATDSEIAYVVRHEWAHVVQEHVYGTYRVWFDMNHLGGLEIMADCMARVMGYRGRLYYTRSCNRTQLDAARRILAGQKG